MRCQLRLLRHCLTGVCLLIGWSGGGALAAEPAPVLSPGPWPLKAFSDPATTRPALPAGMALRAQPCVACHGPEGRATAVGYFPRLAGKPAAYLHEQLQNFREGRRQYPAMGQLLQVLGEDMLWALAQFFAAQTPAYPPPGPVTQTPAQQERGRMLALQGDAVLGVPACVACHGQALTGLAPWVPGLLGLPRDYLNGQLGAWRQGHRQGRAPDCMAAIAQRLRPQDVADVTGWLAAQPVPPDSQAVRLETHRQQWPQAPGQCGIWQEEAAHAAME